MPCRPFKTETSYGFVCGRASRPKPCAYCKRPSSQLCDFPVKTEDGKKKDCDVPMCKNCTQKGISPDVDFCREHYPLALAAFERRQAKLLEKI